MSAKEISYSKVVRYYFYASSYRKHYIRKIINEPIIAYQDQEDAIYAALKKILSANHTLEEYIADHKRLVIRVKESGFTLQKLFETSIFVYPIPVRIRDKWVPISDRRFKSEEESVAVNVCTRFSISMRKALDEKKIRIFSGSSTFSRW